MEHDYAKPAVTLLRYKHITRDGKTTSLACARLNNTLNVQRIGVELVLVVDHHHGVLIVVIGLEEQHADYFVSVFSNLPKLRRQRVSLQPQRLAMRRAGAQRMHVRQKPLVKA